MKLLFVIIPFLIGSSVNFLFESTKKKDIKNWSVVDDAVMGGRSSGNFYFDKSGLGVFSGKVSTENNGGFSSVHFNPGEIDVGDYRTIHLKIKGDGKKYQLRIKSSLQDYQSYINTFETNGKWQVIDLKLNSLYPSFRGRRLDMPNFESNSFEELTFLIANKRNESFELTIDEIWLE